MANFCHVHNYHGSDYSLQTCGLGFGCGKIGCITATSDSPGHYNDAGGYSFEAGEEEKIEIVDVGTPEELKEFDKIKYGEASLEEVLQICKDLGIPVSEPNHCPYCGEFW